MIYWYRIVAIFLLNVGHLNIYFSWPGLSHQLIQSYILDACLHYVLSDDLELAAKMLNVCVLLTYLLVTGNSSQNEVRKLLLNVIFQITALPVTGHVIKFIPFCLT